MVSPVTTPVTKSSQLACKGVWIPPGSWFDLSQGKLHHGPTTIQECYALHEVPLFTRAGKIVPMVGKEMVPKAHSLPKVLKLLVFPGSKNASGDLLEDDGRTQSTKMTTTQFEAHFEEGRVDLTIHPTTGQFDGMLHARAYEIHIFATAPATSVVVNGTTSLSRCMSSTSIDCWTFDGQRLTLQVHLQRERSVRRATTVSIKQLPIDPNRLYRGVIGRLRRLHQVKILLDDQWGIHTVYEASVPTFMHLFDASMRITFDPNSLDSELAQLQSNWTKLLREMEHQTELPDNIRGHVLGLLLNNETWPADSIASEAGEIALY